MSEKASKQPTLPETEPAAAEEQAEKTSNRRPYAEDLRLMHKLDGIFEELHDQIDVDMMTFVLARLCSQYAPPGFCYSSRVKE